MRLIDADALMKRSGWYNLTTGKSIHGVEDYEIASTPTVDAVPVVRCEHCKHSILDDEFRILSCSQPLGGLGSTIVRPYDFCSYGERREAEHG